VCGRILPPALAPLVTVLEPRIARRLRDLHPGLEAAVTKSGACPDCVDAVVRQAEARRSPLSIQESLQLPYPVYAPDETELLPIPRRIRANPYVTGRGVTLALLDSGFYPHPDLTRPANRILAHVDATATEVVERKRFKTPHLTSWHGTMTSSIAAGRGHMSKGEFRGVAAEARLVLVKTGNPRGRGISEKDIARALRWVIANAERYNIRVVNISLGGDQPGLGRLTELDALVEEAVAHGMAVVCAAGNSGSARLVPPASAPGAITVGGYDDGNSLDRGRWQVWHSSYGRGAYGVPKPEVLAPSVWLPAPMLPKTATHNEAVYLWRLVQAGDPELARLLRASEAQVRFKKETLRLPLDAIRRIIRARLIDQKFIHPHYQHVDGTSMAAPIVSGVVAQMLEVNPSLTPSQVKERLNTTARPLPGSGPEQQGRGAINAARAVAAAMRAPGGPMKGLPISPYLTERYVAFYVHLPGAREVALVGSFNGWQPEPMVDVFPGAWRLSIPRLLSGEYRYKFLIDGRSWIDDPENANVRADGYGGYSSILVVP
jgi:serine protease AprX